MNASPLIHASLAALYISVVVFLMNHLSNLPNELESVLIPMAVLGLFVLSAAIMGYLFLYQPFTLYFDNKKKEAATFFFGTVGFFACFVLLFILALVYVPGYFVE
jgi:hypothetical protein